jgi:hypothetical protein
MLRAMTTSLRVAVACGLLMTTAPALAESLASSASSAASESVGSVSTSIGESSDSSTGGKVAAGEYRVVATAPAGAERQRLRLQAVDDAKRTFELLLPTRAAVLKVGDALHVLDRPYGLAFAHEPAGAPFFVALAEAWRDELGLRPVQL